MKKPTRMHSPQSSIRLLTNDEAARAVRGGLRAAPGSSLDFVLVDDDGDTTTVFDFKKR